MIKISKGKNSGFKWHLVTDIQEFSGKKLNRKIVIEEKNEEKLLFSLEIFELEGVYNEKYFKQTNCLKENEKIL